MFNRHECQVTNMYIDHPGRVNGPINANVYYKVRNHMVEVVKVFDTDEDGVSIWDVTDFMSPDTLSFIGGCIAIDLFEAERHIETDGYVFRVEGE